MAIIKLYPGSKKVQQDQDEFARLIGECIVTWAFVNRELFQLYALHFRGNANSAAAAYFGKRTLAQRLAATEKLLNSELSPKLHDVRWGPLRKDTYELLAVRSVIAHQPPRRTGTGRGDRAVYLFAIHIEPAELRSLERVIKKLGKTWLGLPDLRAHLLDVESLVQRLRNFRKVLSRRKSSLRSP